MGNRVSERAAQSSHCALSGRLSLCRERASSKFTGWRMKHSDTKQ
jgi:hypothetical protein